MAESESEIRDEKSAESPDKEAPRTSSFPAPASPKSERVPAAPAVPAPYPPKSAGRIATTPQSAEGGLLGAYEALTSAQKLPDLVAIATQVLGDAATARRPAWNALGTVTSAAEEAKLSRADAETPFGNALKVLETGPEGDAERALAGALWAHAIAESKRGDDERLAGDILWLATHTPFDATPLLDRALGEDAAVLWVSIADRVRRIDAGNGAALGRGEALVACGALVGSGARAAAKARAGLATKVTDPMLRRILATADDAAPAEVRLEGEMIAPPRGPVATTLLALSGLLFVIHGARLVARLALAYKRPTEVSLSDAGVKVKTRTEMLGRVLRESEHVIVRAGLVRVTREVRYPRAAFYAGLLALALGSYVGVRAFVDGVRAASPSLLVIGLVIIILGIGADFVLGSLVPSARGRVRIAFVPRSGRTVVIADVDQKRADDALARALTGTR